MKETAKRWLKLGLGYLLLLLGAAGMFLPILQGFLFLALGLAILQHETEWGRRLNKRLRRKYPRTFARADALYARGMRRLRRLRPGSRGRQR